MNMAIGTRFTNAFRVGLNNKSLRSSSHCEAMECIIHKMKQYRIDFSGFEKLSKNYLTFLHFVSSLIILVGMKGHRARFLIPRIKRLQSGLNHNQALKFLSLRIYWSGYRIQQMKQHAKANGEAFACMSNNRPGERIALRVNKCNCRCQF